MGRIKLEAKAYHDLIWAVFKRDGYKCRHCKYRNNIEAHHIIYRSQQGDDVMTNLITLCHGCHTGHHEGRLDIIVLDILEDNVKVRFIRAQGWKPR